MDRRAFLGGVFSAGAAATISAGVVQASRSIANVEHNGEQEYVYAFCACEINSDGERRWIWSPLRLGDLAFNDPEWMAANLGAHFACAFNLHKRNVARRKFRGDQSRCIMVAGVRAEAGSKHGEPFEVLKLFDPEELNQVEPYEWYADKVQIDWMMRQGGGK